MSNPDQDDEHPSPNSDESLVDVNLEGLPQRRVGFNLETPLPARPTRRETLDFQAIQATAAQQRSEFETPTWNQRVSFGTVGPSLRTSNPDGNVPQVPAPPGGATDEETMLQTFAAWARRQSPSHLEAFVNEAFSVRMSQAQEDTSQANSEPSEDEGASVQSEPAPERKNQMKPGTKKILIAGHYVTVNAVKNAASASRPCLWPKLNRPSMSHDAKLLFQKNATGYVLPKTNKLSVPVVKQNTVDGTLLTEIHNLQSQLKALREHLFDFDMIDVFEIVLPKHVSRTPDLHDDRFDLFVDYAKLTSDIVANSCAWYNLWVNETYIRENMTYTLTLLKNNTEDSLWAKCLEDYDEFAFDQRGGPLMLFLILRRIRNHSETAIEHLKLKIKHLKISEIPGEDVDIAVSLIKSTYLVLQSCSTPDRNQVPDDFASTVLKVFQTSSVPEFNACFKRKLDLIRSDADEKGGHPQWPPLSQLTTLATNTYSRLKNSNEWDVTPAPRSARGLTMTPSSEGSSSSHDHSHHSHALHCFNCGQLGHTADKCPLPRDEAKIARKRKQYLERKKKRQQQKSGTGSNSLPKHKRAADGTPLILNRNNAYVMDQAKVRQQKAQEQAEATRKAKLANAQTALAGLTAAIQPDSGATMSITHPPSTYAAQVTDYASKLEAAFKDLLDTTHNE